MYVSPYRLVSGDQAVKEICMRSMQEGSATACDSGHPSPISAIVPRRIFLQASAISSYSSAPTEEEEDVEELKVLSFSQSCSC